MDAPNAGLKDHKSCFTFLFYAKPHLFLTQPISIALQAHE